MVLGPVVGPTLGGWLAYKITWRWCFVINVPVGLVGAVVLMSFAPDASLRGEYHLLKVGT